MTDIELVKDFTNYLNFEKHLSPQTSRCYGTDLEQFCKHFGSMPNQADCNDEFSESVRFEAIESGASATATLVKPAVCEILLATDQGMIEGFLEHLRNKNNSQITISRKLAALRSFFKFAIKRGHLSYNPAMAVNLPRPEKKAPKFLSHEEIERLFDAPSTNDLLGARDRAILEVLYSTGIRVSELVYLNIDDIDFLGELIHVRSNGKKERIAPVNSSALQAIQNYFEIRRKAIEKNSKFENQILFINKYGNRMNTRSVRRKMDKYIGIAGLDPTISPHSLRHSFAVHKIKGGMEMSQIKGLLGHQSVSSMQIYSNLSEKREEVRDATATEEDSVNESFSNCDDALLN